MEESQEDSLKKLKSLYYQSGVWRKYNWYDFLKEFREIKKELDKPDQKTLWQN